VDILCLPGASWLFFLSYFDTSVEPGAPHVLPSFEKSSSTSVMMYPTSTLFSFLSLVFVACGAPTQLDAATLLQNGEEAQALNRFFQGLKASDPCKGAYTNFVAIAPHAQNYIDGQVACLHETAITKCKGTLWETTLGSCSMSQKCFALPSVSSSGTVRIYSTFVWFEMIDLLNSD